MITIDLEKEDLILLIQGIQPSEDVKQNDIIKEIGCNNIYTNVWDWDIKFLKDLPDIDLKAIYKILKNKELNGEEKFDLPSIPLRKQIKNVFQEIDEFNNVRGMISEDCLEMKNLILDTLPLF